MTRSSLPTGSLRQSDVDPRREPLRLLMVACRAATVGRARRRRPHAPT